MWKKRSKNIFKRIYRTIRGWTRARRVIYLAHSVYEQRKGKNIERILYKMGYKVLNPFDKEKDEVVTWEGETTKRISFWIIKADYDAIDDSDMIICMFPKRRTVGISCEMAYAWSNYIPVYSVVPEDMKGHPWVIGMSNKRFMDIDKLLDYMGGL